MWGGYDIDGSIEKVMAALINESNLLSHQKTIKQLGISERLDFVFNLLKTSRLFVKLASKEENKKSNETSLGHRKKGNNLYIRERKLLDALECYTQSIACAENGSSFLGIAYANRSSILFEGGYYNECLKDIERALQNNYPDNLKEKILKRKEKAINLKKTKQKHINYYTPVPLIQNKNPRIPAATASVEIRTNEKIGRHIVATRDIKVGDVISIEEPFAHIIHPESRFIHCHECLNVCYDMIPCIKCTALYCSEECLQIAFNNVHKYECELTELLHIYPQLFIRMAIKGLKEYEDVGDAVLDESYCSDRFKEINELVTHENSRDFLNTCIHLTAVCVSYYGLIENSNFKNDFDVSTIDLKLKDLLYRTYMINSFNPFTIKKIKYTFNDIKSKRVGVAIYAFTSLFNHSCVPNCEFFHHGTSLVMRATANIEKGEECTICYGISFSTTEISYRRMILKRQYLFDCECKACIKNWPQFDDLPLGKRIPLWFEAELASNTFEDTESNNQRMKKTLADAIRLYNTLEKYEPCKNLLRLQNLITEIYTYIGCKFLDF